MVLSRKADQRIHIGDDIFVTLTKVAGNRVTIGIEAVREISIRRGEVAATDGESYSSPTKSRAQLATNRFAGFVAAAG